MTSHLFIIVTNSRQTCVKMCVKNMRTSTGNAGADKKSSWKNSRKILWGMASTAPPSHPLKMLVTVYGGAFLVWAW